MQVTDKTVFLTGANGGLGKELLDKLLHKGVDKIYACARDLTKLSHISDERVIKLQLNLTDIESIKNAAASVESIDILINNAGVNSGCGLYDQSWIDYEVNVKGTMALTKELDTKINYEGAVVNITSILALINMPAMAYYSASKAALHSLTQALRANTAQRAIKVFEVLPGPIDTPMTRKQAIDKTKPDVIANEILKGIEKNINEIYPDPFSKSIIEGLQMNPKAIQDEFANYL